MSSSIPGKVSVIVPAYNCEEFLAETLDSVIQQTYTNWECIVVDDGSTDATLSIAREYASSDNRIHAYHQENQGLPSTRNNAIKLSVGEFILPLDGDDKIDPSFLEKAINYLNIHSDSRLVYCRVALFGSTSGEKQLPPYSYPQLLVQNCIPATAIYRRADYDKTSGYNDNMRNGLEDWDFWLTLLDKDSKVHQINELLFHYRIKQLSRSTTTAKDNYRSLYRQICQNHPDTYLDHIPDIIIDGQMYASKLETELKRTRKSHAYKLGKLLLRPASFLKRK